MMLVYAFLKSRFVFNYMHISGQNWHYASIITSDSPSKEHLIYNYRPVQDPTSKRVKVWMPSKQGTVDGDNFRVTTKGDVNLLA